MQSQDEWKPPPPILPLSSPHWNHLCSATVWHKVRSEIVHNSHPKSPADIFYVQKTFKLSSFVARNFLIGVYVVPAPISPWNLLHYLLMWTSLGANFFLRNQCFFIFSKRPSFTFLKPPCFQPPRRSGHRQWLLFRDQLCSKHLRNIFIQPPVNDSAVRIFHILTIYILRNMTTAFVVFMKDLGPK